MANIKSSEKSARQDTKRRARNSAVTSAIKTKQKKFSAVLAKGDSPAAKAAFDDLSSALDKAAKRGIIHRNVADRRKSRLNRALSASKSK